MIEQYRADEKERLSRGLPPLPLTTKQVEGLVRLLESDPADKSVADLLENRVEPGVSEAAKIKAKWLEKVIQDKVTTHWITPADAIRMLAKMIGGECVDILIRALDTDVVKNKAAAALKRLTKVYDAFDTLAAQTEANPLYEDIIRSWAKAEWFLALPALPDEVEMQVYKVAGEVNTDDFSPGNQAHSRTDIPLHATHFGKKRFPGGIEEIRKLRRKGIVAFAGDVVGTGSSRKSAVNSMLWHIGDDIDGIPNKKKGGFVLGGSIAPIFYGSARDAGLLPIQCDVSKLTTGQTISFSLKTWELRDENGRLIPTQLPPGSLLDEYRAGGRLNLIIGKSLTQKACSLLGTKMPDIFHEEKSAQVESTKGFTLAQKMIGKACSLPGVLPGTACLPKISTVGSQDTTGPMTMQEIEELACRTFKTDFFLQSFCHTAAYPTDQDVKKWAALTAKTIESGGLALKPGDGVIHSWINKMLVPDQVGTGGDSHTRFPLGMSFPAGSSLIAFAAALGFMPLEMPKSVLVRFKGKRRPGISVRDMVNAIPYFAMKEGLLSIRGEKYNVFAGEILEIEGVDDLSVDEAFELSDASAERSAAACTIRLSQEKVVHRIKYNIEVLKELVTRGYESRKALVGRITDLEQWLENPELLVADDSAEYKAMIEIDLDQIHQPILSCPNNPDNVRLLEDVAGDKVDEVFIGSCMTHLDHFRSAVSILKGSGYAKTGLWIAPTTRLDKEAMIQEGAFSVFAASGSRIETPGCSLCMGNQARVRPGATVFSTSTRNFDNRLGDDTRVYLGSSELAAVTALTGELPEVYRYFEMANDKNIDRSIQENGQR